MKPVGEMLVVGAGLAGLACAAAAAAAGVVVEVFDGAPAPSAAPAHVDVVPNLLRDLATLGLADAVVGSGFVHQGLRVVDAGSGASFDVDAPRLAGARLPAAVGVTHGALLREIADAAGRRGAALRFGTTVEAIDADAGGVRLAGGSERRADLVLLAAGADSPLRQAVFGAPPALPQGQDWWHALLPRPAWVDRSHWVVAPGGKVQIVPVALNQAGIAVLRAAVARPAAGSAPATSLRAAVEALPQPLAALAAQLRGDTPVALRPVRAALLPLPWVRGAVLAVGDCAHAIAPHFGQPAAMSIEDAVVLGELLRERRSRDDLLQRFVARRVPRAGQVHAITTQAAQWDLRPDAHTDLRRLAAMLMRVVAEPA
jgi:2-polyprenyl-6-methoxyphenol hydroxylase-like FAD-dependent oxidoreductase